MKNILHVVAVGNECSVSLRLSLVCVQVRVHACVCVFERILVCESTKGCVTTADEAVTSEKWL